MSRGIPPWAIGFVAGAGLLIVVALSSGDGRLAMSDDDAADAIPPAPPESSADDAEGLARLLTSEHASGSTVFWAALATVAANVARRRGTSIAGLLKTGVVKKKGEPRRTVYGLPWGPQYDEATGIVRWASSRKSPSAAARAFAARYFGGQLTDAEQAAAAAVVGVTSFLEPKQMKQPVAEVLASWGNPVLALELEGFNFYRRA